MYIDFENEKDSSLVLPEITGVVNPLIPAFYYTIVNTHLIINRTFSFFI